MTSTMTAPAVRPSGGVWGAVRTNAALVVSVIVLFTAAGLAVGMVRQPKYAATAKLAVLHLNFGSPGALNGYQSAAQVLADTYARVISANGVVQPLAREFHTSAQALASELSATAVPQSPVFTITAKTTSKAGSIALANAAMSQMMTYLKSLNSLNPDATRLYGDLQKEEAALAAADNNEGAVRAKIDADMSSSKAVAMSASQQAQLSAAQSVVNIESDKASALRNAYEQSLLATSLTQYVQGLQSAQSATSDRSSRLMLFGFIGLALGVAIATGIAVLRESRGLRLRRA